MNGSTETKPLDRQARIRSGSVYDVLSEDGWLSYGPCSIESAAIYAARDAGMERCNVEVRCAANPGTVWIVEVEQVTRYRVTGLRGGDL